MVGYLQSMEPSDVFAEINAECRDKSFPDLGLVGAWAIGGTSRFQHAFERAFEVSPFTLHHFWVDLRA
jgi:hypothetical protein